MATHTTYYNLTKPSTNDKVNIGILNDNADIIDTALHNKVNNDDTQNITTSANKCMMSDGASVEADLASAVPRTASGTTLADLIAVINSLTDIQKINARVKVWANVLSIFQLPENGYAYNFVEVAGDGTIIEYRLSSVSGVSKLQSLTTNGTTTTTSELTVTSWTLYYQGTPIS